MKPILFSTPMVQAILLGRKTMTRRVIKPQTVTHNTPGGQTVESLNDFMLRNKKDFELLCVCSAPYQPGDVLWVRETWAKVFDKTEYRADFTDEENEYRKRRIGIVASRWKPSIHMPRKAARIFLRVTDVRVERLRDMPLFDVWDEGTPQMPGNDDPDGAVNQEDFRYLWDGLNAERGYSWESNPFVWVVSFERMGNDE